MAFESGQNSFPLWILRDFFLTFFLFYGVLHFVLLFISLSIQVKV